MKLLIDILGWTGSSLVILAYALTLLEQKKWSGYGMYLNLLGGVLIAINCYYYSAIPPFASNSLWAVIAIITIYKTKKTKRRTNLDGDAFKSNC